MNWPTDDETPIDESYLKSIGWSPIGNTWYPHTNPPKDCEQMVFWVRVDGSLRTGMRVREAATRGDLRRLLATVEMFVPAGFHVAEDADGERLVRNQLTALESKPESPA